MGWGLKGVCIKVEGELGWEKVGTMWQLVRERAREPAHVGGRAGPRESVSPQFLQSSCIRGNLSLVPGVLPL